MQVNRWTMCLLMTVLTVAVQAKTVASLNQVAGAIHSTAGQAQYAREMNGDALPDGFGAADFAASKLDREETLRLLGLNQITQNWGLLGLKAWPGQPQVYVLTACSSLEPLTQDVAGKNRDNCSYDIDPKNIMAVAVLMYDGQNPPKLMAKPWLESEDTPLEHSAFALENHTGDWVKGDLLHLDFAPYRLNADTRAFGVRLVTHVGYAGGGALNQAMTLFAIIDGALKPILSVPMYAFEDLAGAWNADGSRQHEVNESENSLAVLPQVHEGFHDVRLYPKGKPHARGVVYRWQASKQRYIAVH